MTWRAVAVGSLAVVAFVGLVVTSAVGAATEVGTPSITPSTVDTGDLDFHLRQGYDVTYDEYLSGMTYDEMTGADQYPQRDDERRYQM
jgi:hypothetical protein